MSGMTDDELRALAEANVATFPPLTGEQLAAIRRIFAPDHLAPLSPREEVDPH